jgi:TonB family protein
MKMSGSSTVKNEMRDERRFARRKALAWVALACVSLVAFCIVTPSRAQEESKNERKLITRVEPDYPPVLRMRQIGGTVKLQISITPAGNVDSPRVLGGNPILAESAVAAVKKWKYAPAEAATTTTISLEFNPYR